MSMLTLLVTIAMAAVLASLGLGVAAMVKHGEVAHHTSAQWMTMRVAFQAVAVGLLLLALVS